MRINIDDSVRTASIVIRPEGHSFTYQGEKERHRFHPIDDASGFPTKDPVRRAFADASSALSIMVVDRVTLFRTKAQLDAERISGDVPSLVLERASGPGMVAIDDLLPVDPPGTCYGSELHVMAHRLLEIAEKMRRDETFHADEVVDDLQTLGRKLARLASEETLVYDFAVRRKERREEDERRWAENAAAKAAARDADDPNIDK